MEAVRELFQDVVFGNGRIVGGVLLATLVVVVLARATRIVKF